LGIGWVGAGEQSVVCGVGGSAPPGRQQLPGVCLGYPQQLGNLPHGATGAAHLPHRDGLLLTNLVNVAECGCADLLDLLVEGDISAPGGFNPTLSVLLPLEVVDGALAWPIQSRGRLDRAPYSPGCSGGT